MRAVVLVGGFGTRLRPLTYSVPKPMLPVGDKPMLEHIIDRAMSHGFNHFILAIHYLGHMVEDYFGDGAKMNARIEYIREQAPLGTAGALGLLTRKPEEEESKPSPSTFTKSSSKSTPTSESQRRL